MHFSSRVGRLLCGSIRKRAQWHSDCSRRRPEQTRCYLPISADVRLNRCHVQICLRSIAVPKTHAICSCLYIPRSLCSQCIGDRPVPTRRSKHMTLNRRLASMHDITIYAADIINAKHNELKHGRRYRGGWAHRAYQNFLSHHS